MIQIFEVDFTKNYHLQNEHELTIIFYIRIHSLNIIFFYGFHFYYFLGYHIIISFRLPCSPPFSPAYIFNLPLPRLQIQFASTLSIYLTCLFPVYKYSIPATCLQILGITVTNRVNLQSILKLQVNLILAYLDALCMYFQKEMDDRGSGNVHVRLTSVSVKFSSNIPTENDQLQKKKNEKKMEFLQAQLYTVKRKYLP